jgi:hypothetical protein
MAERLTEATLERMVIAATHGESFEPSSAYEAEVWERIKREVAVIRRRPNAIVDLSLGM